MIPVRGLILGGLLAAALPAARPLAAGEGGPARASDAEAAAALEVFRASFRGAEAERASAARTLAAVRHRKVLDALAHVLADPSPVVREEAIRGLGAWEKSPEAAEVLGRALAAARKRPAEQVACLDALGRVRDWGSVPVVVDHFNEPEIEVAQAAIRAAARIRSPACVPRLIDVLKAPSAAGAGATSWGDLAVRRLKLQIPAQLALQQITAEAPVRREPEPRRDLSGGRAGRDTDARPRRDPEARRAPEARREIPRDAEEWEAWWKTHGAEVTARLQQEDREEREAYGAVPASAEPRR